MTEGKEGLDVRKVKDTLEKGYWKEMLSFDFFWGDRSEEVRARKRCGTKCEVRNETSS